MNSQSNAREEAPSVTMPEPDVYYIEVLGKALDVLEAFVHIPKRQLTLQEISRQLRINKNAVFRILYTLAEHGYIVKEEQKYELGPKLLDLSNAKLRHWDLLTVAAPLLESLRDQFGETVNLGVLDDGEIRYIGVWESRQPFRLAERVGARDCLHYTALGKAHLAYMPFDEVRRLLRKHGMPRQTEYTITSLSSLKPDLDATRARGYALDIQESVLAGCCVGVPILKGDGSRPLAAISVSGPLSRLTASQRGLITTALQEVASAIQLKMGAAWPHAGDAEKVSNASLFSSKKHVRPPRLTFRQTRKSPVASATSEP
jgi:IclR family transcriptional regulator, KDG regulon repressor